MTVSASPVYWSTGVLLCQRRSTTVRRVYIYIYIYIYNAEIMRRHHNSFFRGGGGRNAKPGVSGPFSTISGYKCGHHTVQTRIGPSDWCTPNHTRQLYTKTPRYTCTFTIILC